MHCVWYYIYSYTCHNGWGISFKLWSSGSNTTEIWTHRYAIRIPLLLRSQHNLHQDWSTEISSDRYMEMDQPNYFLDACCYRWNMGCFVVCTCSLAQLAGRPVKIILVGSLSVVITNKCRFQGRGALTLFDIYTYIYIYIYIYTWQLTPLLQSA